MNEIQRINSEVHVKLMSIYKNVINEITFRYYADTDVDFEAINEYFRSKLSKKEIENDYYYIFCECNQFEL